MKYEILDTKIFTAIDLCDEEHALYALGGCSDYGNPDDKGLGTFQVDFYVNVTNNNNENEKFTVIFQPEERFNGMRNYSGFEMETASTYGADADESDDLFEFVDYDETIIEELKDIAKEYAKKELHFLLKQIYPKSKRIKINS